MSLITQAYVVERYGLRLDTTQLGHLFKMDANTVRNRIALGTFPVETYKENQHLYAAYQAVAEYLDHMYEKARDGARAQRLRDAANDAKPPSPARETERR